MTLLYANLTPNYLQKCYNLFSWGVKGHPLAANWPLGGSLLCLFEFTVDVEGLFTLDSNVSLQYPPTPSPLQQQH